MTILCALVIYMACKKQSEDEANIILLNVAVKSIRATLMEQTAHINMQTDRQTDRPTG